MEFISQFTALAVFSYLLPVCQFDFVTVDSLFYSKDATENRSVRNGFDFATRFTDDFRLVNIPGSFWVSGSVDPKAKSTIHTAHNYVYIVHVAGLYGHTR